MSVLRSHKEDVPPTETQNPPTPEPEVHIVETPEQLPVTGSSLAEPLAVSALVAAIAYTTALMITKRQ